MEIFHMDNDDTLDHDQLMIKGKIYIFWQIKNAKFIFEKLSRSLDFISLLIGAHIIVYHEHT